MNFNGIEECNETNRIKTEKPKLFNTANELFDSIGIKKIDITRYFSNPGIFNELTIWFGCELDKRQRSDLRDELTDKLNKELNKFKGNTSNITGRRYYTFTASEKAKEIKVKDMVVGHYLPLRNLFMVYINPFKWNWGEDNGGFLWLFKEIINGIKNVEPKLSDITQISEREAVSKFKDQLEKQTVQLENQTNELYNNISELEKSTVGCNRTIQSNVKMIEALEKLNEKVESALFQEIEKIKQLSFVKKVVLSPEGLTVDLGKVTLKGRRSGKDYTVYAGDYTVIIMPTMIKIDNKNSIPDINKQHPHVYDKNPCFGDGGPKMMKLLAEFKLTELVFQLFAYLKRYHDESPHINIHEYLLLRIKENKFDIKGELLKKETPNELKHKLPDKVSEDEEENTEDEEYQVEENNSDQ